MCISLDGHLSRGSIGPGNWLWKGIRVGLLVIYFILFFLLMSTIVIVLCMYDDYEFHFSNIPIIHPTPGYVSMIKGA